MKNRLYWGFVVLIIILLGVSIGLFMWNTDTEPEVIYNSATPEVKDNPPTTPKPSTAKSKVSYENFPPPPGETEESGYWHDGHWHRTAPSAVKQSVDTHHTPVHGTVLGRSAEEIAAYREEWGVDPPPRGANWQHIRNDDGTVLKHYDNTTIAIYKVVDDGFAPTQEQWEQHEFLQRLLYEARRRGDTSEYDRILSELKVLIANSRGPAPVITGGVYFGDPISEAEKQRQREEAIRDVYRKFGLEHTLQSLYDSDIIPDVAD